MLTKRIHERSPVLSLIRRNLATGTTHIRVQVKRLPQMIDALRPRHRAYVQQYTHIGLQARAKGVEKPTMAVDLLRVALLHAEQDLRGHDTLIRVAEVQVLVEPEGRRVLKQMRADRLVVEHALHVVAGLVYAKQCEHVEYARVHLFAPVGDNTDDDLLCREIYALWRFKTKLPSSTRRAPKCASSSVNTNEKYFA